MAYDKQIIGKDSIFFIKYNDIWTPISCEVSSPISEDSEDISTTTRENGGWRTSLPTMQGYSLTVSGVLKVDTNTSMLSYYKLREMKRDKTVFEWARRLLDGVYIDSGKAYISSISDSNTVNEDIKFDMTLTGFGKPEINNITHIDDPDGTTILEGNSDGFIDITQDF